MIHKKIYKSRKKNNKKFQSGGEVIGSGSFGTVIKPAIMCSNSSMISKVFTGSDSLKSRNQEAKLLDKIASIDP